MRRAHLAAAAILLVSIIISPVVVNATILTSKVVDAETNEPMEGAVVVVVWRRPVFTLCMDSCSAFHDATETLTDLQGNFTIDISMGWLANDRKIAIYKPGYHLPGYYASPWLRSRENPPPGESQLVRLIKINSREKREVFSYPFFICGKDDESRFCVPPRKIKLFSRLKEIERKIQASESNFPAQYSQTVPLHKAALQGDFRSVRALLDSGANDDEPEKDGHTALMMAVEKSRVDFSDFVSTRPREMPDDLWEVRLKILAANASRSDTMEVVRTLLAAGANPNLQTKDDDTALTLAISTGREISSSKVPGSRFGRLRSPELVTTLLQGGADPNLKVGNGLTPLMIAAGRGLAEIVNILLAHGADVNAKADFGLTAHHIAVGDDVIEALKKARGPSKRLPLPPGTPVRSTNNLLREAAWVGNAVVVRILITDQGADPNSRDQLLQETPIYAAIRSGNAATVEVLLEHGANPNVSVPHSGSPLGFARKALKPELATAIIKALIDAGAIESVAK